MASRQDGQPGAAAGSRLDSRLVERGIGAYLGLAVGDSLGATVEFMTPREIAHDYGEHRHIVGGGWLRLSPGSVTDDTGMALALGESIIERRTVDEFAVAEAFSNWMRSKPIDIGHTVRRGISHFRRTGKASVPHDEDNAGNGACMRCLPVALHYYRCEESTWIAASRRQAHVTHNSHVADAGTEAVLRMVIGALHGATREELAGHAMALSRAHPVYRFDRRKVANPSGWLVETVQVVFQAFFGNETFEDVLVDVVNRGGDADTTGAIAGMLAGAYYGQQSIPGRWLTTLDAETAAACQAQAIGLLSSAPRDA